MVEETKVPKYSNILLSKLKQHNLANLSSPSTPGLYSLKATERPELVPNANN